MIMTKSLIFHANTEVLTNGLMIPSENINSTCSGIDEAVRDVLVHCWSCLWLMSPSLGLNCFENINSCRYGVRKWRIDVITVQCRSQTVLDIWDTSCFRKQTGVDNCISLQTVLKTTISNPPWGYPVYTLTCLLKNSPTVAFLVCILLDYDHVTWYLWWDGTITVGSRWALHLEDRCSLAHVADTFRCHWAPMDCTELVSLDRFPLPLANTNTGKLLCFPW